MLPRHYARFVIYLSLKPGVSYRTAFTELQHGLSKTFIQLPWLNGKVFWQSRKTPNWRPGQLEVQYTPINSKDSAPWQLKYKELNTDLSFDELKELGFPADTFEDEDLLWAPFAPDLNKGADVFIAQASFIPGACILCASLFHSVADGMADVSIFKIWADHCQDLPVSGTAGEEVSSDCADRNLLECLWEKERSQKPIAEMDNAINWSIIGLDPPKQPHRTKEEKLLVSKSQKLSEKSERMQQSMKDAKNRTMMKVLIKIKGEEKAIRQILSATQPELKSRVFYISPANFAALKRECVQGNELVSGNDAISALLWRALIKARLAANNDKSDIAKIATSESQLEMTIDGRPYLALPPTYLGNVVLLCRTRLSSSILTSQETSVATVAQALREATSAINSVTALDAYSLARSLKSYRRFDERSTPVAGARMLITSLLAMPAASMGFGDKGIFGNGGKAEGIRPLMGALNKYFRICFVMPPTAYGGIEIVFNLSDPELDCLLKDEEFEKYAMQVN
jgi:hypothetical protein